MPKGQLTATAALWALAVLALCCDQDGQKAPARPHTTSPSSGAGARQVARDTKSHGKTEAEVEKAFRAWLVAAEKRDAKAFKNGLSRASRSLVEDQLALPGEADPYAGILSEVAGDADRTEVRRIVITGDVAEVTYAEQGQEDTIFMVREQGGWKVDLLSRVEQLEQ